MSPNKDRISVMFCGVESHGLGRYVCHWLDIGRRDDGAIKLHRVEAKYKRFGIMHSSVSTANV